MAAKPLTNEELAELRAWASSRRGSDWSWESRLIATLDYERKTRMHAEEFYNAHHNAKGEVLCVWCMENFCNCGHVKATAESAVLRAALVDAAEGLSSTVPYVSQYFRDKWCLDDYETRAMAIIDGSDGAGARLLVRMAALEAAVEAARPFVPARPVSGVANQELKDAFAALDRLPR